MLTKQEWNRETSTKRKYNKQAELKNTITAIKNILKGIISRLANTEEQISNLKATYWK